MTVELATGSYRTFTPELGLAVTVTLGRPKFPLRYEIAAEVDELKPLGLFHLEDPEEFERRYRARLGRIGIERLRERFEAISRQHDGKRLVLLCFERAGDESCHRRVFARWWVERTGQGVPEVGKRSGTVHLSGDSDHIIGGYKRVFRGPR